MYRPWVSRRSRASCLLSSMSTTQSPTLVSSAQPLQAHAVRFEPGTDLLPGLMQAAASTGASSCCVLTAVGSLEKVSLRMASASRLDDRQPPPETLYMNLEERVEIVSLVGTFSKEGSKHLHMSVSKRDGTVVGGHLMSGTVFTTLELVLGTLPGVAFTREIDPQTGYDELVVRPESLKLTNTEC